ncbi:M23 family metallopeptidase [Aestuariimicrobium ganziense]|uniref:M23 family metallopeptidase n=1 Tax=Aestuariimicrobium ganziense TaxID=2773677 RepID=UPI001943116B|nr:M23 family metallopeptidase [Aestuariimicrobium ganziense]
MSQVVRRASRRAVTTSDDAAFTADSSHSILSPIIASLSVSLLAVAVAAGVVTATAAHSDEQDQTSIVVDVSSPNQAMAAPAPESLTAEQVAALKSDETSKQTAAGGLTAFGQRGTTVNRNSVRTQIDQALVAGSSTSRTSSLARTNSQVTLTQAQSEAKKREQRMLDDIARIKKEAKRIEEEKRRAAELLKQMQKTPGADGASGVNLGDLSALRSGDGVCLPMLPGTFSVGAHFGQYGVWARYHTGQDFPAAYGTPIYAVAPAVVGTPVGAWWPGTNVVLHHLNGGSTLYAHMSRSVVRPGQVVKPGDVIGYVGSTGNSNGNHLHFEYYPPGTTPGDVYAASNPMAFLRSLGLRI